MKKVRIELTGNRDRDFKLANQSSGYKRTPDNFTWHHHQESGLMQLIPSDLHDAVRHTGGVATSGIKPYK
ncbi:HNH endonuclease [Pseudomonas sp. B21-054]|uniref:HNH endonuclease n=1 Tax=Pseudomonas sp. B21-054 TaxID=2895494 RepID=UPI0039B6FA94